MPRTHTHTHSISIEESPFTDAGVIIVDNWTDRNPEPNQAPSGSTVIGLYFTTYSTQQVIKVYANRVRRHRPHAKVCISYIVKPRTYAQN